MRELTGKTALITGASRGLGSKIADRLADEGANLILVARSASALAAVAQTLAHRGARVDVLTADLSRSENLEPLVKAALDAAGQVDILVNNAATSAFLPFDRYALDDLERELFTNLTAPLILTRHFLPYMLQRGLGHIVNISSLGAEVPLAYLAAYTAAKAGLAGFTRSLRQELAGTGVGASAILPGVVRDAGMIHDFETLTGFTTGAIAGGCSATQVANAVVRAIHRDLPDVVINMPPTRPLLALLRLAPRSVERFLRAAGLHESAEQAVAMNLQAEGRLTGTKVAVKLGEESASDQPPAR